jgi:RNA polymerase sigma-54 factor
VVGNIDDDGYLRRTVEELVDDLSFREGLQVTDEKMHEIVEQVKQFDPVGVGAYDLQECLLIQLQRKTPTPAIELAITILQHHFDYFSRHQFGKILTRLDITEEQLKEATSEIVHLNPRPGSAWIGTVVERNQSIIIPDFIVEQEDEDLVININQGNVPELHVSADYQQMLEDYAHVSSQNNAQIREAARFVKINVESAKCFIDAIRQRNETMMRSIEVLVGLQRDFFLQGDSIYLKPLTLKDVADRAGYDVSTISRTFANKYVQTEFGVFPMKFFFSDKIVNSDGAEISTREIKQKLREVIEQEDKTNPVTDDQLVEVMHQSGYPIARRTVAKYREQMGIPVARMRRQLLK